jgi:hypothetical protein
MTRPTLHALALASVAGCTTLPASPSFQADVAPILAARCVRCHADPPIGGAPTGFLLDGYPDRPTPEGAVVFGAASIAASIARRAAARTMPPRFPLDDDQILVLERWAASAPSPGEPAPRGPPRADNRPPAIALTAAAATTWDYDLHDPDGDLVVGVLRARLAPGDAGVVVAGLHSGRARIAWITAGVPAGTYQLVAELDDGGAATSVALGPAEIR